MSVFQRGVQIVYGTPVLHTKVALALELAELWARREVPLFSPEQDADTLKRLHHEQEWTFPARPPLPRLVRVVPSPSELGVPASVVVLHTLTHIELNAVDMYLDTVVRFACAPARISPPLVAADAVANVAGETRRGLGAGSHAPALPESFVDDILSVVADEARHFVMCEQRLRGMTAEANAGGENGEGREITRTEGSVTAEVEANAAPAGQPGFRERKAARREAVRAQASARGAHKAAAGSGAGAGPEADAASAVNPSLSSPPPPSPPHPVDYTYGVLPATDALWQLGVRTRGDVASRLAVIPLAQEARGLDSAPRFAQRLRSLQEQKGAAVVDVIGGEEERHVALGTKWLWHIAKRVGAVNPSSHPPAPSSLRIPDDRASAVPASAPASLASELTPLDRARSPLWAAIELAGPVIASAGPAPVRAPAPGPGPDSASPGAPDSAPGLRTYAYLSGPAAKLGPHSPAPSASASAYASASAASPAPVLRAAVGVFGTDSGAAASSDGASERACAGAAIDWDGLPWAPGTAEESSALGAWWRVLVGPHMDERGILPPVNAAARAAAGMAPDWYAPLLVRASPKGAGEG